MCEFQCSAANWLKPPAPKKPASKWPRYLTKNYLQNNVRKVVFQLLFIVLNVVLFSWSLWRYREENWCVMIARGCGMCLNFNSSFVVVLMLRHTLTFLRSTKLGNFLPLDQSVSIHKEVGVLIFAQSVAHTLAHLGNAGDTHIYDEIFISA